MDTNDWYPALLSFLLSFEQQMPGSFGDLLLPRLSKPLYYAEDTPVLKKGDVATDAYWPIEGYLRTFEKYKPEEDREHLKQKTVGISVPGKVSLLSSSFMNQSPSAYFQEISKGSTMVSFSYTDFKEMGAQMPEVYILANQIIAMENEDREIERKMRAMKKARGYAAFLKHFGTEVESFIYQMHIASFMDTNPATISRIRTEGGYGDAHLRK